MTKFNKTKYIIVFFCLFLGFWKTNAQQQTLISHQDFLGYQNPALFKGGKDIEMGLIHRTQWEGLGPISNMLFYTRPFFQGRNSPLPNMIGGFLQHEDFSLLNRTNISVFVSEQLSEFNDFKLNAGFGVNFMIVGFDFMGLNDEELLDPELPTLGGMTYANRVGISIAHSLFEWGISSKIENFQQIESWNSTLTTNIPIADGQYKLLPLLIYRVSEQQKSQFEMQARIVYKNKISLTSAFRQNFGMFFQIGFTINRKIKVSYGPEFPIQRNSSTGISQEFFGSLKFETKASKRHRQDSIFKVERNAINKAKMDSIRNAELEKIKSDLAEKKQLEYEKSLENISIEESDTLVSNPITIIEKPTEEPIKVDSIERPKIEGNPSKVIAFQDLPLSRIKNNTHVILNRIGFENDMYLLKPYAFDELDKLVSYIKHHKHLHIEIQGHTDDSGTIKHNHELSKRRARAVYNYLISRQVDPERMNVVGYGEDKPLYPNINETNRGLNRRIEVVFFEMNTKNK